MLLDSGDIVLIADSQGVIDSYEATGSAIDAQAPVAVLVNKGTASASEVILHLHRDQSSCTSATSQPACSGVYAVVWQCN